MFHIDTRGGGGGPAGSMSRWLTMTGGMITGTISTTPKAGYQSHDYDYVYVVFGNSYRIAGQKHPVAILESIPERT